MTNVLIVENHNKIRFFFLVNNRSQYWGIIANEVLQPRFPRLGVQDTGHVEEGESCWSWLPSGNRNQDSKETWQTRICRGMLTYTVYVLIHPRRPRCLRLIKKIQLQERAWRLANSISGGSREGARGGGDPLIFRPNLKHFLETNPPTLCRGLDDLTPPPPPLIKTRQDKIMLYLESYTVLCTSTFYPNNLGLDPALSI